MKGMRLLVEGLQMISMMESRTRWSQIVERLCKVMWYDWWLKERDERLKRSISDKESKILAEIVSEMKIRYPQQVAGLGGNGKGKRTPEQRLRQMRRWHLLATKGGLIAVVLSHWFQQSIITHASEKDFEMFVKGVESNGEWMCSMVEEHWPDAPTWITSSRGMCSHHLADDNS